MSGAAEITVLGVGDVFLRDHDPDQFFAPAATRLRAGNVVFGNCEQPYGAHYPEVPAAMARAGFTVVSVANNHILDYGEGPYLRTLDLLHDSGIATSGGGSNIVEARRPAVVEQSGVRIATLSYSSIQVPSCGAGTDRAGCAPIRVRTGYMEQFEEWPGYPPRIVTEAYPEDVETMMRDVASARQDADLVIVSMHNGPLLTNSYLCDYQRVVAKAAIDAGAEAVLGHHPHILKGIEVYRGKPIFYSLGNFVMKTHAPIDTSYDSEGGVITQSVVQLNLRTWPHEFGYDPDYPLFPFAVSRDTLKTMIVKLRVRPGEGVVGTSFIPCLIRSDYAPYPLAGDQEDFHSVYDYVSLISAREELPVKLEIQGDEIAVTAPTEASQHVT
jgi:hypothetical protein